MKRPFAFRPKNCRPGLALTFFLGALAMGAHGPKAQDLEQLGPPSASFIYENAQYVVIEGAAYEIDGVTGNPRFVLQLYDPAYIGENYLERGGKMFRRLPGSDETVPVLEDFSDGFENAASLLDLIGLERGWTSLTLQSQAAPTVADYVDLRQEILKGQADFADNRIEPSPLMSFSGTQSLRAYTPVSRGSVPLTKASLDTELLYFAKGDHFWFSAMFFIEEGTPTSLVDLEADYIFSGPGMRLMVSPELVPRLELKWADKPTYRLNRDIPATLPVGRWFKVDLHFFLSDTSEGVAEMWLDDQLIISASGQTLPMADTVLTRLELGITANPKDRPALVYVDQVSFSGTAPSG